MNKRDVRTVQRAAAIIIELADRSSSKHLARLGNELAEISRSIIALDRIIGKRTGEQVAQAHPRLRRPPAGDLPALRGDAQEAIVDPFTGEE